MSHEHTMNRGASDVSPGHRTQGTGWWRRAALAAGLGLAAAAFGQEDAAEAVAAGEELLDALTPIDAIFTVNNLWILIAAFLVFIMHLGFACVETGLTRSKNTVNILFKNTAIVSIGILTYALMGFNLMYPGGFGILGFGSGDEGASAFGVLGFAGFGIGPDASGSGLTPDYNPGYTYWTDFIFQAMFAATAATIVSGAVAERVKLPSFLIFSTVFVAVVYPIIGSWQWGGGFLNDLGFHDFAGSTLVHSVGGWGALAGAFILGPRLGKYVGNSGTMTIRPIMGHSMPLAAIGVFLLWFGWFGFNGGSVLSASPGDPSASVYGYGGVSLVIVTTTLAGAAGMIAASIASWLVQRQPDLSMALNGILAGLVGITAGADCTTALDSVIIGAIAGVIVVFSVIALDKLRIDDPVGAISVHLVCGIWGTLAVGIFGDGKDLVAQIYGVLAAGAFAFPAALALFFALKFSPLGLRVSREEEILGLDLGEHGMEAYAGFQIYANE